MIFHLEGSHIAALATDKTRPAVIRMREIQQFEDLAEQHGIRIVANDPSTIRCQADVSQSTPEKLFSYLEAVGCQAVDVEIADLSCWSRGVEVFALQRHFAEKPNNLSEAESRDSLKASLRGLPIDQVHDTVNRILLNAAIAPPQVSMTEEEIVKDLTDAGYLVPTASRLDRDEDSEREQQLMQNWQQDIPKRKPRPGQDPSDWMTYSD